MPSKPLLWLACGLGAGLALAAAPERASAEDWEIRNPTGRISAQGEAYEQPVRGLPNAIGRADVELEDSVSNGTYGLKLAPWVFARSPNPVAGVGGDFRVYAELKEAWVERVSDTLDIRLGNQIFSWGAADQINPTDIWNSRDLIDPFGSTKLPITAAELKLHPPALDRLSLEVIGTPFFRASRLPIDIPDSGIEPISLDQSRWLLPAPTTVVAGGLVSPLRYQVTEATFPATWQLGARLVISRVGGWDFSLSAFDGVEPLPRFAFTKKGSTADPSLPIILTLNPSYHRTAMYGVDGAGSVSLGDLDLGLRFEAAYYQRDNSRALLAPVELQHDLMRDDYVQAVLGADYTFQRNILGTVVYWNLQYVHYQRLGHLEDVPPGAAVIEGLPDVQPWDRDLVLYIESRVGAKLKLTGQAVASLVNGDGLITPGVQYAWSDNFKTSLLWQAFVGNSTGFFGQFRDNSRGLLSASYSF